MGGGIAKPLAPPLGHRPLHRFFAPAKLQILSARYPRKMRTTSSAGKEISMYQTVGRIRVIRLYGTLGARFGRVHRLVVNSAAEAIRALSVQLLAFEQFFYGARDQGMVFAIFHGRRKHRPGRTRAPARSRGDLHRACDRRQKALWRPADGNRRGAHRCRVLFLQRSGGWRCRIGKPVRHSGLCWWCGLGSCRHGRHLASDRWHPPDGDQAAHRLEQ